MIFLILRHPKKPVHGLIGNLEKFNPQMFEGNLEVKLPTIWTVGKAEVRRAREEKSRREKIREEKESEKEDAGAPKGRKVAKHCVFLMIC